MRKSIWGIGGAEYNEFVTFMKRAVKCPPPIENLTPEMADRLIAALKERAKK